MEKDKKKIYYGWYIVAMAFLGNFMATGTGFYAFNAFLEPLCSERGWSRTDINIAPLIGMAVYLICMLIYGTIIPRVGPRLLMAIGSIIAAVSFLFLGQAHSIWIFYILCILIFIGHGAMNGIVANTAVNNWFISKRGKAMGIATAGISLSGAVIPFAVMIILKKYSLNHAFIWISIMLLIVSPVLWFVMRNRPEDHGLLPDGEAPHTGKGTLKKAQAPEDIRPDKTDKADSGTHLWTFSKLAREPAFWKIGITYGLVLMGVSSIMFQLKPRFRDIGYDDEIAMAMMAATSLIGAAGKYIWGILCDRFEPRRITTLLMAANGLGLGLALFQDFVPALVLFILIFGFAMGGLMSTFPIIIANLFGRESFPVVYKYIGLLAAIEGAGFIIMGQSFDRTGSYDTAYTIFFLMDIIAVFIIMSVRKPSKRVTRS